MTGGKDKEIKYDAELDTRGLFCPEPIFEVRTFSESLDIGQCFKVLADDPAAEEDITRLVKRLEYKLLSIDNEKTHQVFRISKSK